MLEVLVSVANGRISKVCETVVDVADPDIATCIFHVHLDLVLPPSEDHSLKLRYIVLLLIDDALLVVELFHHDLHVEVIVFV